MRLAPPAPRRVGPVLALLLGLQPLAASADEPDDPRSAALDTLTPGSHIRVDFGGEHAEGKLRERTRFGLVLTDDGSETTVETGSVEGLWVRDRFTGQGALLGGVLGLAAGAGLGSAISHAGCDTGDCQELEAVVIGGLVVGAVGALVGGLTGTLITRWDQVYP